MGVSTNPGWTEFTRIFSFAKWMAAFFVIMRTAPFDAWYANEVPVPPDAP